jgi:predicted dehydrogenase
MIRCAVVGFGWWGQTIARRLAGSDRIRVTRVVEPQRPLWERAEAAGLTAVERLDEVLNDPDIDAVIIATPHTQHEAQVVASARAGKHVFCEKPLGLSLASAQRSVQACTAAGVLLGVGHERRFEPAMEALRRLAVEGALGTILHAEAAFSHDKLADLPKENWRKDVTENPAGGMTACGVHLTDFLLWTLGPIEHVSGMLIGALPGWDCGVSCQLGFSSGATATISAILATPHDIHFRIYGRTAWAEVVNDSHPDSPDGETRLILQRTGQPAEVTVYPWADSVRANFEEFADAVAGRGRYRFTPEEILQNVAVLEACTLSGRQHRTIRLADLAPEPVAG